MSGGVVTPHTFTTPYTEIAWQAVSVRSSSRACLLDTVHPVRPA
jgi:hypothetical protein